MGGKRIVVIGADGMTGREVLKQGAARGHDMVGTERDVSASDQAPGGAELAALDALSPPFKHVFERADAVVSCLGVGNDPATLLNPPPIYDDGTRNIVAEMKKAGVARLVVISATFVESPNRGPLHFKLTAVPALARVFAQMSRMEDVLRDSDGIDWTAVRPGWLLDAPATDDWVVRDRVISPEMIRTRHADLASFMLDVVEQGTWIHGTPAIARDEPPEHSDLTELLDEFAG
ncbi:NAD(P)-dependent oxidoreductase [Pseudooctadecabacter sp.]|uniref:NAD(P)-dependent oxidoreductase n=1 Tax=Pseudooctadecabacter sp. TaxID=1966338 RepID=UPI0025E003EB|nr:NAD(P)H-binding protein [Pseudooctadecabacter sp.]